MEFDRLGRGDGWRARGARRVARRRAFSRRRRCAPRHDRGSADFHDQNALGAITTTLCASSPPPAHAREPLNGVPLGPAPLTVDAPPCSLPAPAQAPPPPPPQAQRVMQQRKPAGGELMQDSAPQMAAE